MPPKRNREILEEVTSLLHIYRVSAMASLEEMLESYDHLSRVQAMVNSKHSSYTTLLVNKTKDAIQTLKTKGQDNGRKTN